LSRAAENGVQEFMRSEIEVAHRQYRGVGETGAVLVQAG
jgi:hypothetical protein